MTQGATAYLFNITGTNNEFLGTRIITSSSPTTMLDKRVSWTQLVQIEDRRSSHQQKQNPEDIYNKMNAFVDIVMRLFNTEDSVIKSKKRNSVVVATNSFRKKAEEMALELHESTNAILMGYLFYKDILSSNSKTIKKIVKEFNDRGSFHVTL